ncbi:MAG: aldo/keto reductase [Myxococcales bacterium]|nr:aldo/keto reductase [Myxococcales bacterium]
MRRALGGTGLTVSALGLGCGPLGAPGVDDAAAARLVHAALDHGIDVFDTAPSYGASEERLARALAGRRGAATLVTKGGYGVPGVPDWTPECIERGVERALRVLCTDVLDVFLLHSCDADRLRRGDLLAPLARAREAGKVRAVGYSGDGEALDVALGTEVFDVVECSVSLVDRAALRQLARLTGAPAGVLGKRALANAAWARLGGPNGADEPRADVEEYARRVEALFAPSDPPLGLPMDELFLRFAAHAPRVSCALVGTSRVEGVRRAAELVARGPLPREALAVLEQRHLDRGAGFAGLV